jgi:hypothetical protein
MSTLTLIGNVRTVQPTEKGILGKPYLLVGTTCPQRPDLSTRFGIGLKTTHQALAHRLIKAINAGVVFENVHVAKDVHDDEYITSTCTILTRLLNAELKRKGF